jgi:uncharacterized protein (DUF1015 family)
LKKAFAGIDTVYLADGHHRLASAGSGQISTLYLSTDQLRISAFHRVVVPSQEIDQVQLFKYLNQHFFMSEAWNNHAILPAERHKMGMLINGSWYHLVAKNGLADRVDAALLQDLVLAPVFGIADPATDPRLKCLGGKGALTELLTFCNADPAAIAFTLAPLSIKELIRVADAGEVLPPKSSWIDPKVPYGLLLYHNQ